MIEHRGGYTVSPSIELNEEGQEVLNYDSAEVYDHTQRLNSIQEFEAQQDQLFGRDEASGEMLHQFEQPFDEAAEEAEIEPEGFELPPQDQEDLQSIAGGSDGYAHMTAFAAVHLPEEFVSQYDRIMSSGSYPEMQEVIQALHGWYINNNGPQWDGSTQQQPTQEESSDGVTPDFVDQVMDHYGEAEYQGLMSWAQSNLSDAEIQSFDNIMENGTQQDIASSIHNLFTYRYQQSQ